MLKDLYHTVFELVFSPYGRCDVLRVNSETLRTECAEKSAELLNVNSATVSGIIPIGGGYSQLEELCGALNMPCISKETWKVHHNLISHTIKNSAWELIITRIKCEIYASTPNWVAMKLHSALIDRIIRIRTVVMFAIKYRKKQSEDKCYLLTEELREDILSPFHVLGDHSKSSERHYFCDGLPKFREVNLLNETEKAGFIKNYCFTDQNSAHKWKVDRSKRITSSFFGKICKMKTTTSRANVVKEIRYQVFNGNYNTNWGIEKVSVVIVQFERENPGIVVKRRGLIVDEEYPFLGASPDGLIDDDQIIEVKCPSSAISMSALDVLAKGKIKYLGLKDGKPQLKLSHNYMYQVQHPRNMPVRMRPHIKSAQEAKRKKKFETGVTGETTKIICEENCVM
ncbi:hypothetical protein PR048_014106 [Dryococelus australis]|uniref:YqaJ viral recombinase domain-containing protein n=1 Tax=Dryococelus australis TaxID=614101 RepID=A0ABQ9HDG8_9NEOP|nr:hypothetical protein PR048_014106 [Dryococelus australis]